MVVAREVGRGGEVGLGWFFGGIGVWVGGWGVVWGLGCDRGNGEFVHERKSLVGATLLYCPFFF